MTYDELYRAAKVVPSTPAEKQAIIMLNAEAGTQHSAFDDFVKELNLAREVRNWKAYHGGCGNYVPYPGLQAAVATGDPLIEVTAILTALFLCPITDIFTVLNSATEDGTNVPQKIYSIALGIRILKEKPDFDLEKDKEFCRDMD